MKMQKIYNQSVLKDFDAPFEKENITQNLALSAHAEISSLIEAVNYRKHHIRVGEVNKNKILFESVDIIRYIMAIMNIWDIDPNDFEDAFCKKDDYLWMIQKLNEKKWNGGPVAIIDMDDVIAEFRQTFAYWLEEKYKISIDVGSDEYYFISELSTLDVNPEKVFENFMLDGGFEKLPTVQWAKEFLTLLRKKGYWIQLLTARPKEKLNCLYDTFSWLKINDIPFDRIDFSTEKFRWCAKSEYYDSGAIKFAIDDSPKHAIDYSKHGIKCYVPEKNYNKKVWNRKNIFTYKNFTDIDI